MNDLLDPVHPGEVLAEEFLRELDITQTELARALGVSHRRINEICRGKRSVTADTALRLARYFGNSPQFWMGLQADYDLEVEQRLHQERINREVQPLQAA